MKLLCTLGPATLNGNFLKKSKSLGISILRLNMSHTKLNQLDKTIKYIRKYTNVPICIDSEGAQIRTGNLKKEINLKKNSLVKIKKNHNFFYPEDIFDKLKKGDKLSLDFNSAVILIKKKKKNILIAKVLSSGKVEKNKAVTLNRDIELPPFTNKDLSAFEVGKKNRIKYYAISFASKKSDISLAKKILGKNIFLISKIESFSGLKNSTDILNYSDAALIDRGDLSRQVRLTSIPAWQKKLCNLKKKLKKKIFIATNLLETVISKKEPTRAEINDIYNSLRDGADGLVLAAETAIGKNPLIAIKIIRECMKNFKKNYIFELSSLSTTSINKQVIIEIKNFKKQFKDLK